MDIGNLDAELMEHIDSQVESISIISEGENELVEVELKEATLVTASVSSPRTRSRSWTAQQLDPADLRAQCEALSNQVYDLQNKLLDQKEVNEELSRAKQVLTDEIMDLTRTLFEEANSMVANEARARASIEISRKQLERELEATKEHLKLEKVQLRELREKIYQMRSNHSIDSGMSSSADKEAKSPSTTAASSTSPNPPPRGLKFHYYDDLFPNRRFDSRIKYDGPTSLTWDQIARHIEPASFKQFSRFVESCSTFGDEEFLSHPLMKSIFDLDVSPCLNFELKPKAFIKKLVFALLKNTFSIDACSQGQETRCQGTDGQEANGYENKKEEVTMDQLSSTPPESNMERVRGLFNHFTASVSSLPDALMSVAHQTNGNNASISESNSPTKLNASSPSIKFCTFCGSSITDNISIYRVRLMDSESWMCVDAGCRERLVAAGQLYAFMRHLRSGLFSRRPVIDLYYDVCMIRRHLFYARLGVGATHLFLQSDFEQLVAISKSH